MYIKKDYDFSDLKNNSWSGAVNTLARIEEANKEDELMAMLEELFNEEVPTETAVNDFLWFEPGYIYEALDMPINEE